MPRSLRSEKGKRAVDLRTPEEGGGEKMTLRLRGGTPL